MRPASTPRGFTHTMEYDAFGRLELDEMPPEHGGWKSLERIEGDESIQVNLLTAESRDTHFTRAFLDDGSYRRTVEDEATDLVTTTTAPKRHIKVHATRGRAADSATGLSRRGCAPEEHSNPSVRDSHFHPVGNPNNERIHMTYPQRRRGPRGRR